VTKDKRREFVRQQDVAILVHHARSVAITVEQESHVGACRRDGLFAFVRPRIGGFRVKAAEVFTGASVDLGYVATKALERVCKHACARTVHGVNYDAWGSGCYGRTVHKRDEVIKVRIYEVLNPELSAICGRLQRYVLLYGV
jgi:hypothetical protein